MANLDTRGPKSPSQVSRFMHLPSEFFVKFKSRHKTLNLRQVTKPHKLYLELIKAWRQFSVVKFFDLDGYHIESSHK